MKTKKIISLLASLAMISSMFVAFATGASAAAAPVFTTSVEKVDADTYAEWTGGDLAAGYEGYMVQVDLSGLEEMKVVKSGTRFNGRRVSIFTYQLTFDSVADLDTVNTFCVDGAMTAGDGFDGKTYTMPFSGDAGSAYPAAAATIAGDIENAVSVMVTIKEGKEVNAAVTGNLKINTYNAGSVTASEEFEAWDLTFTPAAIKIGNAGSDNKLPVALLTGGHTENPLFPGVWYYAIAEGVDSPLTKVETTITASEGDRVFVAPVDLTGMDVEGVIDYYIAIQGAIPSNVTLHGVLDVDTADGDSNRAVKDIVIE